MAKKNDQKQKNDILQRHTDAEGRDAYKSKGTGIPGRETF